MAEVSTAFVKQYGDMVQMLNQQESTRLRRAISVDMDFNSEYKFYEQLGETAVQERTTRHEDTPVIDPDHQRRRVSSKDYVHSFLLDKEDELNMIINPASDYAMAQAMAFGRKQDQVIYADMLGTAYTGKDGGTATTLASYSSGAHEITATSGLTVDKILDVKLLLDLANNDPMKKRYWAVTAYEIQDLLNTTEVKSADYNTVKALAQGDINSFSGFEFIVLPPSDVTNGIITRSSGVNSTVAFVEGAFKLGMKRDLQIKITERPDKNYATQIWAAMSMGGVRMQEKAVVKVDVTNS